MTRMTFDEAVDFVMERLAVPTPEQRATRDKVRKRIRYGLGDGTLPRLDVETLDVDHDAFVYWAREKWRGKFDIPISIPGDLGDTAVVGGEVDELHLPSSLSECHHLLRELTRQNRMLSTLLNRQAAVVANLRPLAEQYQRNREKNRISAKKPRNP